MIVLCFRTESPKTLSSGAMLTLCPEIIIPYYICGVLVAYKDKSVLVYHLRRKVVIVLHSAILIKFPKANYLTFECLLSRNSGDFSGSVMVWVDFFEYFSIKQFIVFQVFAK